MARAGAGLRSGELCLRQRFAVVASPPDGGMQTEAFHVHPQRLLDVGVARQ
jgi:hypothetical protein